MTDVLVAEGESLAAAWRARWTEDPDAVALVDLTDDGGARYARRDVERGSAAAAGALAALGVRRGDRVLFSGAASVPYLLL